MKRMLIATVILIVTCAVFIMSYAIVSWPVEYTTHTLQESYDIIAENMSWTDSVEVKNTLGMMPYFLAAGIFIGILLLVIWYFVYAQKKEYERY